MMNKKRGLTTFSKLPDDGNPWAPNKLLTPEQKKKKKKKKKKRKRKKKKKHQLNSCGPSNRHEAPVLTN